MSPTYTSDQLNQLLAPCLADPSQVRTTLIERRAKAHDASHFLFYPQAVVVPRDAAEVGQLMRTTAAAGLGLTFRSGGTSLSGQAGSDQVLADVRRYFSAVEVLDSGQKVRVQPGVTVARVNAYLAPYGRKLGPDPASEVACTIGGVVANNSSGMACGITANSYQTLDSLVVVLPTGTVVDTGAADADDQLRLQEPAIYQGLLDLRQRIIDNPQSLAKIRQQYSMKNTMGYGLNSLADFANPVDILTHLMIGSEGTIGFIASATFRTVPVKPHAATALLVFDDLYAANQSLPALVEAGAATLELMDRTSLLVGQSFADCPPSIKAIQVDQQAAILLEFQALEAEQLAELSQAGTTVLQQLPLATPATLTSDAAQRANLWSFRKGLYTSVAAGRQPGTTALLEDICVPVERLADTCVSLGKAFDHYGYANAVIFGHAKDGNIHFMLTDDYEQPAAKQRLGDFTAEMVDLIIGYDGSCKAEHGTGRVMAPFVRRQFGDELYGVMVAIKDLFDPGRRLNPGVMIDEDETAHLEHFKTPVPADVMIDRCVECGYCEPICPSRNLTLTPRQRIAVFREIVAAGQSGDKATADELRAAYIYDGIDTCAVDGLCGTACPVQINTGLLVKQFRSHAVPGYSAAVWTAAAKHWAGTTHLASKVLSVTSRLGNTASAALIGVDKLGRAVIGEDVIPLWSRELPGGGARRQRPAPDQPANVVYLPACVNAMFGPQQGQGVQAAFEALCERAGISLLVPEQVESLCCGTPWTSKGILKGKKVMATRLLAALAAASDNWRLPVVCDASSCTEGIERVIAEAGVEAKIIDAVQFTADHLLEQLGSYQKLASLTLHLTCSSTEIGLNPALKKVAEAVAERVVIPVAGGCCAFAGDRGLLHPELTAAATAPEAAEVAQVVTTAYASCNRTCELGMRRATGQPYRHVLELLAEVVGESE